MKGHMGAPGTVLRIKVIGWIAVLRTVLLVYSGHGMSYRGQRIMKADLDMSVGDFSMQLVHTLNTAEPC